MEHRDVASLRDQSNEEDTPTNTKHAITDHDPLWACVNGKQQQKKNDRKTNICYHIQPSKRELSCAIAVSTVLCVLF